MSLSTPSTAGPKKTVSKPNINTKISTQLPSGGPILGKPKGKKTLWKNVYDSPYRITWPSLSPENNQLIFGRLSAILKLLPPRQSRAGRIHREKKSKTSLDNTGKSETEKNETGSRGLKRASESAQGPPQKKHKGPTNETIAKVSKEANISEEVNVDQPKMEVEAPKKIEGQELVFGLNAVTRALEKDELRLVIVGKQITPFKLIQHIPILCKLKGVPLCPLAEKPETLAALLGESGIRTLICLGFKKNTKTIESPWDSAVKFISERTEPFEIKWLPEEVVKSQQKHSKSKQNNSETTQQTTGGISKKANNDIIPKTKVKYDGIELQPLRIKKIQHTAPIKPPKHLQGKSKPKPKEVTTATSM